MPYPELTITLTGISHNDYNRIFRLVADCLGGLSGEYDGETRVAKYHAYARKEDIPSLLHPFISETTEIDYNQKLAKLPYFRARSILRFIQKKTPEAQ